MNKRHESPCILAGSAGDWLGQRQRAIAPPQRQGYIEISTEPGGDRISVFRPTEQRD
ncbi:hypothetical protein PN441_01460 [Spirulina major CS-329]|uniref:hypothetical protein n=1 Tax=Spirulina TaxID=1154 RepID=UPI00233060C5|nr:hypothetical protein [Spirulina subsalsa]MDB9495254.1 hypothetical protein [Spirulina subsalsa CS-330]MDB9501722.1 hypothetical protein [Spirulina major CS-329]